MNVKEAERRAKIAKIRMYRKIKQIKEYRRKLEINALAAKMLTYISIPAFAACTPLTAAENTLTDGSLGFTTSHDLKTYSMMLTLMGKYDVKTAVQDIVQKDNEEFLQALHDQYNDIKSKGAGRRAYVQSLFGNINYCNMAVIRVLKQTSSDYMNQFLEEMENPALCSAFVSYVQKNYPDCIRYESSLSADKLHKGDIVVTQVPRGRTTRGNTATGNHTVTYEGEKFLSFNSESKYDVSGKGYIINMNKIREKALEEKIKGMSKQETVSYLVGLYAKKDNKTQEKVTSNNQYKIAQVALRQRAR